MSLRTWHGVLIFAILPIMAGAEPEVLQKREGVTGAHWDQLDFADIAAKPTTLDGYGITDAIQGDRPIVQTLMYQSDTALVEPIDATLFYPSYGNLAGMVCDVISAPSGADIELDLRTGDPLVSVYAPGEAPRITAGQTSTLALTPLALETPVALVPRTKVQVRVLSAPDQNIDGTYGLVADLPLTVPAGFRALVTEDNHVWTRNAYDAVVWTNTGLPAGGEWLGAVATYANLPGTHAQGDKWLVTDTARVWMWDVSAWADQGGPVLLNIAFTAIASSADLPTAALSGVYFLALNTGFLYRNDAAPWLDSGLLTTFAGAGLRCGLYIYPLAPE